uniref:Uncharacterized protein n=1 Tax=Titanophycus setchellii TaxID=940129 RepID=A0A1G4NYK0_9FLOR|nr:Hypothetical protein ycf58 [Titanophycus setchellii]SCW23579.1 Hypothetical protein ycf58 [Titanophycus setchellii]
MSSLAFAKLNLGNWVTLRTSYFPYNRGMDIHKSRIKISNYHQELYFSNRLQLNICRKNNIHQKTTQLSYCINMYNHTSNVDIESLENWMFCFNKANHISYKYNKNNLLIYEKSWFVNPNLRLNIDMIYKKDKCVGVSFSSDIKIA